MKKSVLKKAGTAALALTMIFSCTAAYADAVAAQDTYLSLGADLTEEEKETVLDFFDITDLSGYNVNQVTNAEEYQYLGSYVSTERIGNRALSSVLITPTGGSEINVKTYNINYCTEDMYRNALVTAGVSGANVTVAGPFVISGTAALVGTIKAYEDMTGKNVADEVIKGSVDEITTTGEVGESVGDVKKVAAVVAEVKKEIAENPDMTGEEIEKAVIAAAEDAGISLSEEDVQKLGKMLENLQGLDIDWDNVKKQSKELLKGFGNLVNSEKTQGIFDRLISWIHNLLGMQPL